MKPTTTVESDHVVIRWPLADVVSLVQRNVEQNTEWAMRDYKTADMVKDAIRTAINDASFRPTLIAIVQDALKVEVAAMAKKRLSRPGVLGALFNEAKGGE